LIARRAVSEIDVFVLRSFLNNGLEDVSLRPSFCLFVLIDLRKKINTFVNQRLYLSPKSQFKLSLYLSLNWSLSFAFFISLSPEVIPVVMNHRILPKSLMPKHSQLLGVRSVPSIEIDF
jgi:hypothetical protein